MKSPVQLHCYKCGKLSFEHPEPLNRCSGPMAKLDGTKCAGCDTAFSGQTGWMKVTVSVGLSNQSNRSQYQYRYCEDCVKKMHEYLTSQRSTEV